MSFIPLKVGIVGTGYAATKRAEALQQDARVELVAVSGHTQERLESFCRNYSVFRVNSWEDLVKDGNLDLIVIANANCDHGKIARAALSAGKHAIVEYPLSFYPAEARELMELAQRVGKLLHVEHIELLGGLHQAIRNHLPEIGKVFFARYATVVPQHPVKLGWTYNYQMFGFPLIAALSRVHRFTDLFGKVSSVACNSRFWDGAEPGYYRACLCNAQLRFASGVMGEVTYGKGETFWKGDRTFEILGEDGTLIFDGEEGTLIKGGGKKAIEVASRKGLFAKDTTMVLDHLELDSPLYVNPSASYYALLVADAAREAAETGKTIYLDSQC
jgi:biliverdin reductase